jgi:hypothetical protein
MPSAGLLLYPEDVEKDDWLHNPDANDPDKRRCDIFNRRALVNVGGLAFITLGILALFVGYPIMYVFHLLLVQWHGLELTNYRSFVQRELPKTTSSCSTDPMCLSDKVPLLRNQRTGLIDPDTPSSAMNKQTHDGVNMQLVVCVHYSPANAFTHRISSPTNSINLVARFILAMILSSKLSIFGMEQHKILNGTIQMRFLQTTERSTLDLMHFKATT